MTEVGIFSEGSETEAKSPTSRKNREKWGTQISNSDYLPSNSDAGHVPSAFRQIIS